MKRLLFFVCLILSSFLIISCTKVIENDNFETDGYISIDGEKVVPEYVLKIDDTLISLAEYRYYYLNQKAELDGGDDKVWDDYPEYASYLSEYVEDTLVEVYAIRSLAGECQVEPDLNEVKTQINESKQTMSASEYQKGLKEYHLTEELYEYILQGYQLYSSLFDYYFGQEGTKTMSDKKLFEYIKDNYTHVKHILITPNTTMSDEDYEAHLKTVIERAKNGEDFDELIGEYSSDTAMPSYGYYYTDEEMPDEFVEACKELEVGEISDIVKTSYGYHIIKKLETDKADIDSLTDVVYNELYSNIINERIEAAIIEYAPEYAYISPKTLK